MIVQCDCGRKLKPKTGCNAKPGQRVILTCPCGDKLAFRVPDKPRDPRTEDWADKMMATASGAGLV